MEMICHLWPLQLSRTLSLGTRTFHMPMSCESGRLTPRIIDPVYDLVAHGAACHSCFVLGLLSAVLLQAFGLFPTLRQS